MLDAPGNCVADLELDARVLDANCLKQLRALDPNGGKAFVVRVLHTFHRTLLAQQSQVAEALAAADWPRLAQVSHALKSASASVGALDLARICAAQEVAVREGRFEPLPELGAGFSIEAQRVLRGLERQLELLNREGAA